MRQVGLQSVVLLSIAVAALAATGSALAGWNADGKLIVHDAGLEYSAGSSYCRLGSVPASCEDADGRIDGASPEEPLVWKVFAAFPPTSTPRVRGASFGVRHGSIRARDGLTVVASGSCAGLELAMDGWPASGTGTMLAWDFTQTERMIEVYWFAGYTADSDMAFFQLRPHPEQGAWFADDSQPSFLDPIAGLGTMGFGMPGDPCPSDPAGACCFTNGLCSVIPAEICAANGGVWEGENAPCEPSPCQVLVGACCTPEGLCMLRDEDWCLANGYQFLGGGTSCIPNPCQALPGACCRPDGTCTITTAPGCSGSWQGGGSTCEPNPCPQPGACCLPHLPCQLRLEADCAGVWQGPGTTCNPDPCPGACCDLNGNCEVILHDDCADFWFAGESCDPNPCASLGACCQRNGSCTVTMEQDCSGSWLGGGTRCEPNPCPQPGACCALGLPCELRLEADCAGAWHGPGTTCDPDPCHGACCDLTGICEVTLHDDCANIWFANQPCDPNPCESLGACCMPDGECRVLFSEQCASLQGSWLGAGVACDPNPCGGGACCFSSGVCRVRDYGACDQQGGEWEGPETTCEPNPCPQPPHPFWLCFCRDGSKLPVSVEECKKLGGTFVAGADAASFRAAEIAMSFGACCLPNGECAVLPLAECSAQEGESLGPDTLCDPPPCTEARRVSWGRIKAMYR